MSAATVWLLALVGGFCGLDVVSFPQAMLSRPIIASTLAGACVGSPGRGLVVGALLELIALDTLPFGASRYPEWGSASVAGGAAYASAGAGDGLGLVLAAGLAVLLAAFGGLTMVWHRTMIARWARGAQAELAAGSASAVRSLQWRGILADFVRATAVTVVGLALSRGLLALSRETAWFDASGAGASRVAIPALAVLAVAVAASAVWKAAHGTVVARWCFAAGLAIGIALLGTT